MSKTNKMSLGQPSADCTVKKGEAWADMLNIRLGNPVISWLTSRMPYR